jgi:predicted MFS family arabinose efflux permease
VVEQRAARYRDVFAVGEFRALFAAHLASVIGDQFARVALVVLVFQRTGSATLTALTYALTFLPALVAGPLLSGLADRYPRRTVMITCDLVRGALVAAMAIPGTPFVVLCALLVCVQLLAAPANAARAATLPLVLSGDRYLVASALSNMAYQAAQLVGFLAGGLVVVGVHASGALLIDAATFVFSAVVVRLGVVARASPDPEKEGSATGWLAGIAAGGRLVWRERRLRYLVGLLCIASFPVAAEGLAVPYAANLSLGPEAVGLLLAADPLGSLIGMAVIDRLRPAWRMRLIRPLAVLSCALLLLLGLQPGLMLAVVVLGLSGAGSAYLNVVNAEYVRAVPDGQRGQAFGLASTAMRVSQGVAVLLAGASADVFAPGHVIAVSGALGAVCAWIVATRWHRADVSADA